MEKKAGDKRQPLKDVTNIGRNPLLSISAKDGTLRADSVDSLSSKSVVHSISKPSVLNETSLRGQEQEQKLSSRKSRRKNIVSSARSFGPLIQQKQATSAACSDLNERHKSSVITGDHEKFLDGDFMGNSAPNKDREPNPVACGFNGEDLGPCVLNTVPDILEQDYSPALPENLTDENSAPYKDYDLKNDPAACGYSCEDLGPCVLNMVPDILELDASPALPEDLTKPYKYHDLKNDPAAHGFCGEDLGPCVLNTVPDILELDASPASPEDQIDERILNIYTALDQSLTRVQSSKSRQKALELHSNRKAPAKSGLIHESISDAVSNQIRLSPFIRNQPGQNNELSTLVESCIIDSQSSENRNVNEAHCSSKEMGVDAHFERIIRSQTCAEVPFYDVASIPLGCSPEDSKENARVRRKGAMSISDTEHAGNHVNRSPKSAGPSAVSCQSFRDRVEENATFLSKDAFVDERKFTSPVITNEQLHATILSLAMKESRNSLGCFIEGTGTSPSSCEYVNEDPQLTEVDQSMPVFESSTVNPQTDTDDMDFATDGFYLSELELHRTTLERASMLAEICISASLDQPSSHFSSASNFHEISNLFESLIDDGHLDRMEFGNNYPLNVDLGIHFQPRSSSSAYAGSLGKCSSSKPELTCFPIDEDPSSSEENKTMEENTGETLVESDSSFDEKDLTNIGTNPTISVSGEEGTFRADFVDFSASKFSVTGTQQKTFFASEHQCRKKTEASEKENSRTRAADCRKHQISSIASSAIKRAKESVKRRISKPSVSNKISLKGQDQELSLGESTTNNIVSNVQQKQAATLALSGKRDVEVKPLETAEAAKCLMEKELNVESERQQNEETTREEGVALQKTDTNLTLDEVVMNNEECGTSGLSCDGEDIYVMDKSPGNEDSIAQNNQGLSYDISPYCSSDEDEDEDEDDDDELPIKKYIPSWASKTSVRLLIPWQKKMDPDVIFPPNRFCSTAEITQKQK